MLYKEEYRVTIGLEENIPEDHKLEIIKSNLAHHMAKSLMSLSDYRVQSNDMYETHIISGHIFTKDELRRIYKKAVNISNMREMTNEHRDKALETLFRDSFGNFVVEPTVQETSLIAEVKKLQIERAQYRDDAAKFEEALKKKTLEYIHAANRYTEVNNALEAAERAYQIISAEINELKIKSRKYPSKPNKLWNWIRTKWNSLSRE